MGNIICCFYRRHKLVLVRCGQDIYARCKRYSRNKRSSWSFREAGSGRGVVEAFQISGKSVQEFTSQTWLTWESHTTTIQFIFVSALVAVSYHHPPLRDLPKLCQCDQLQKIGEDLPSFGQRCWGNDGLHVQWARQFWFGCVGNIQVHQGLWANQHRNGGEFIPQGIWCGSCKHSNWVLEDVRGLKEKQRKHDEEMQVVESMSQQMSQDYRPYSLVQRSIRHVDECHVPMLGCTYHSIKIWATSVIKCHLFMGASNCLCLDDRNNLHNSISSWIHVSYESTLTKFNSSQDIIYQPGQRQIISKPSLVQCAHQHTKACPCWCSI